MATHRSFSRHDAMIINRKLTGNREAEVTSSVGKRLLRETHFSREQINHAFAQAKKKVNK
jgi:hypothetical protein